MKILTRGVTEATVVGLRPATEYELRVLSQDHIGDGLFSRPIYARTLGESRGRKASESKIFIMIYTNKGVRHIIERLICNL